MADNKNNTVQPTTANTTNIGDIFGDTTNTSTKTTTPANTTTTTQKPITTPVKPTPPQADIPTQTIKTETTPPAVVQVVPQIMINPQEAPIAPVVQTRATPPIQTTTNIPQIMINPQNTPIPPVVQTRIQDPVPAPQAVQQVIPQAPVPTPQPVQQVIPQAPVPAPQPVQQVIPQTPVPTPQPVQQAIPQAPVPTPQAVQQVIPQAPVPAPQPVQQVIPQTPVPAPQPVQQVIPQTVQQKIIPPVPVITTKKGSKVSPISFFIGCGIFGFLIIGIISATLYFAVQNPSKFNGILTIESIKTGLKLFTGLFFGMLFLGGFIGGIFNLYKLITTKIGSKIKYIIGIIFSIALLTGSVLGGMTSFKKINEIIGTTGDQNSLILPSIEFKDGFKPTSEGYPIIAPTKVMYQVNKILLDRFISTNFPNKKVNTMTLDCGNGTQLLPYDVANTAFQGTCLYMNKGDYTIKIISNTTDLSTNITTDETTELGALPVVSEISFIPSNEEPLQFNDAKDEIIIGKAPTKLNFKADKLFSDFKLDQYNIQRDLDEDGIFDKTNVTNFSRQFRKPQVQKIAYTLPDLPAPYNKLVYQFDFRVEQNDVPICTINATAGSTPNIYTIDTTFDSNQTAITSYLYKVKNLGNNKFITAPTNKKNLFDYEFDDQGAYVIYLQYLTEDGKQGNCESDTIEVGASDFNVSYTTQYKGPKDTQWQSFQNSASGATTTLTNETITTTTLPTTIQLTINSISPKTTTTKQEIRLDNQLIQSPDGKTYEILLQNATHKAITITTSDTQNNSTSTITIPLTISQKEIIGALNIFPDTVGTSPFKITLDASTTTVTDKDDEIIYFSWDFGDGKKTANSSQSRVEHTYIYDEAIQDGTYTPSVVITTKKGKKATLTSTKPILIKKPNLVSTITIDSHPSQIAHVEEKVDFSLQTDGAPTKISWDFGTEEGIECEDRSCAQVPMFFNKAGTYVIKATTTYKDLTTSIATTKLIVEAK